MDGRPEPVLAISQQLAGFADATRYENIPPDVVRRAKYLMMDAVGIALAASRYEFAQRELLALSGLGTGDSTVFGMATMLGLRDALLMNGSLVHGLDYDDTYLPGSMHLTASAVPCALGLGAQAGASGRDMLTALIVGMEVSARVSAAGKGGFQQAGFHPTGVAGVFGCTLLASRLWQMNVDQMVLAQGIALSTACGTVQPMLDGTWTKRMHPGWAAASSVTASAMARQGYLGPRESYEGKFGLYALYLGEYAGNADLSIITDGLSERWEFARSSVKLFPACHQAHAFMNAAIEIARSRSIAPAEVESVTALIAKQGVNMVCEPLALKRAPQDSYAAQFSLPYTVACSLLRREFGLADLEPARLKDPSTLELAGKLAYEIDPAAGFPRFRSGEIIVRFRDGTEARQRNNIMPDAPVDEAAIEDKFFANAQMVMSRSRAQTIMEALLSIEQAPSVEPVLRLLGAR
jgi:2-methylcitrate dehydratase PrpD